MARVKVKNVWHDEYLKKENNTIREGHEKNRVRIVSDAEIERKRNAKRKSREEIAAENRRDKEIDPVYLPSGRKRRVKSVLNNK